MTLRLAVVQQETVPGAVSANRDKALAFAAEALQAGADLILFHEELLVGYVANLRDLAEPVGGPTTQAFRALLRGSTSRILYGLTEREGEHCYIAGTVVGAQGMVANYRKTHLWWRAGGLRHELTYYLPGDRWVTFDVQGHRAGIMICYDGHFPEVARSYAHMGCDMLFWLNNRNSRGYDEVRPLAGANAMIIASACCCGHDESGSLCRGGSNITDLDGSLLAEIWDREGIIYADVEPERVPSARRNNPWYTGQRRDLYL